MGWSADQHQGPSPICPFYAHGQSSGSMEHTDQSPANDKQMNSLTLIFTPSELHIIIQT